MTTTKLDVRLIAETKADTDYGMGSYMTFIGRVCYIDPDDGKLKNPMHGDWKHPDIGHLDSLAVTAQVGLGQDDSTEWYGVRVDYRQPYSVNLEWAQTMVNTLKRIERHEARLNDKFGQATDLAARVGRIGDSLGISSYGWITKEGRMMHSDSEYRWGDIDGLRWHLDTAVRDARPKVVAVVA